MVGEGEQERSLWDESPERIAERVGATQLTQRDFLKFLTASVTAPLWLGAATEAPQTPPLPAGEPTPTPPNIQAELSTLKEKFQDDAETLANIIGGAMAGVYVYCLKQNAFNTTSAIILTAMEGARLAALSESSSKEAQERGAKELSGIIESAKTLPLVLGILETVTQTMEVDASGIISTIFAEHFKGTEENASEHTFDTIPSNKTAEWWEKHYNLSRKTLKSLAVQEQAGAVELANIGTTYAASAFANEMAPAIGKAAFHSYLSQSYMQHPSRSDEEHISFATEKTNSLLRENMMKNIAIDCNPAGLLTILGDQPGLPAFFLAQEQGRGKEFMEGLFVQGLAFVEGASLAAVSTFLNHAGVFTDGELRDLPVAFAKAQAEFALSNTYQAFQRRGELGKAYGLLQKAVTDKEAERITGAIRRPPSALSFDVLGYLKRTAEIAIRPNTWAHRERQTALFERLEASSLPRQFDEAVDNIKTLITAPVDDSLLPYVQELQNTLIKKIHAGSKKGMSQSQFYDAVKVAFATSTGISLDLKHTEPIPSEATALVAPVIFAQFISSPVIAAGADWFFTRLVQPDTNGKYEPLPLATRESINLLSAAGLSGIQDNVAAFFVAVYQFYLLYTKQYGADWIQKKPELFDWMLRASMNAATVGGGLTLYGSGTNPLQKRFTVQVTSSVQEGQKTLIFNKHDLDFEETLPNGYSITATLANVAYNQNLRPGGLAQEGAQAALELAVDSLKRIQK